MQQNPNLHFTLYNQSDKNNSNIPIVKQSCVYVFAALRENVLEEP